MIVRSVRSQYIAVYYPRHNSVHPHAMLTRAMFMIPRAFQPPLVAASGMDGCSMHMLTLTTAPKQRLGMGIVNRNGKEVVDTVVPGSPADRAGVHVDDVIKSVNGKSIEGMAHTAVVAKVVKAAASPTIMIEVLRRCQPTLKTVEAARQDFTAKEKKASGEKADKLAAGKKAKQEMIDRVAKKREGASGERADKLAAEKKAKQPAAAPKKSNTEIVMEARRKAGLAAPMIDWVAKKRQEEQATQKAQAIQATRGSDFEPMSAETTKSLLKPFPKFAKLAVHMENPINPINEHCKTHSTRFVDPEFQATYSSIDPSSSAINSSPVCWKRLGSLYQHEPTIFAQEYGPAGIADCIVQGHLGDCWLIATFASICSTTPGCIRTLFEPAEYNPHGVYSIKFFVYGKPVWIIVDDLIPCGANGKPIYAHSRTGHNYFVALLEKAVAKFYGSYSHLGGSVKNDATANKVMELLTGGIASHVLDFPANFLEMFKMIFATGGGVNLSFKPDPFVESDAGISNRSLPAPPTSGVNLLRTLTLTTAPKQSLGMGIVNRNGKEVVDTVVPGSPADRAGVHVDDVIKSVNGESIKRMAHTAVVAKVVKAAARPTIDIKVTRRGGEIKPKTHAKELWSHAANLGLIMTHAYSVVDVAGGSDSAVTGGRTFLRLRNPWGVKEWKGPWSDASELWSMHPDIRDELITKRGYDDSDDGSFWMEARDVKRHVNQSQWCWSSRFMHTQRSFQTSSATGGAAHHHFYLTVTEPGMFMVQLNGEDWHYERFIIIKGGDGTHPTCTHVNDVVARPQEVRYDDRNALLPYGEWRGTLERGAYWIVAENFKRDNTSPFTLKVVSSVSFKFEVIKRRNQFVCKERGWYFDCRHYRGAS